MLEVRVMYHNAAGGRPREIANMEITQVAQGEGSLRDYAVKAWVQPMLTRGRMFTYGGVDGHDRLKEPLWMLVYKAIASMRTVRTVREDIQG